jgi:hypothetical protein
MNTLWVGCPGAAYRLIYPRRLGDDVMGLVSGHPRRDTRHRRSGRPTVPKPLAQSVGEPLIPVLGFAPGPPGPTQCRAVEVSVLS